MSIRPETMGDKGYEDLRTCPYDPSHRIKVHRFFRHLLKCAKNHPDADTNYKKCPFNATHIIPIEDYPTHLESCPDKDWIERQMQEAVMSPEETHANLSTPFSRDEDTNDAFAGGENWDEEVFQPPPPRPDQGFRNFQTAQFKKDMLKSLEKEAEKDATMKRRPVNQPRYMIGMARGRNISSSHSGMEVGDCQLPPMLNCEDEFPSLGQVSSNADKKSKNAQAVTTIDDQARKAKQKIKELEQKLRQIQQLEEMKKSGKTLSDAQKDILSKKFEIGSELKQAQIFKR